jgi:hypothetical protein
VNEAFDAEALIDATLPLLGLTLSAQSRAAVRIHLAIAEKLSRLFLEFPLDDEEEPAPVFSP